MTKRLTTIRDVAKESGCSIGVVSTVLNNRKNNIRVSAATRERIQATAARLNYRPSILARSFQSNKSFLVGIMALDVNATLLVEFLKGVHEELGGTDYSPLVETHYDWATEEASFRRLTRRRVDGLLVTACVKPDGSTQKALYAEANDVKIPLVQFFGRDLPDVPKANMAVFETARLQTQHLLGLGHRHIVLLTHERYADAAAGSDLHWDAWEQFRGYEAALREAGLAPHVVTQPVPSEMLPTGDFFQALLQGGVAAAGPIRKAQPAPTAVICYHDLAAAGLMRACREQGLRIPTDLSVLGSRDLAVSMVTNPPLTSVEFPAREIGRQATAQLMRLMRGEPTESVSVPGRIVERASTAAPMKQS
jgi:DNA-binding LacI/PurR family transcriptional regulator